MRRERQPRPLPPVRPSVGFHVEYKRLLNRYIDAMRKSVMYWVVARYRQNEPLIAQDALASDELPANELKRAMGKLSRRWQKQINDAAPELAKYFSTAISKRSDAKLRSILRRAGISVRFKMTREMRDVMNATVSEQVGLIKSIPQQYFKDIEGHVMRSVAAGRDLQALSTKLEETYGITKRRAALISRDQNNKATATLTRVRQLEVGITRAIWLHSHGGKVPRPRHLAHNGKSYDVAKGAPVGDDDGNFVHPGEEINCRCVSKPIVPGFS